jgi:protein required for attachment to host cells
MHIAACDRKTQSARMAAGARPVDVSKCLPYLPCMTKSKIAIPHGAWIIVADGKRALLLQNDGDEVFPNLRTDRVLEHENPPTHEQGTDRPGRYSATPDSHRSALQETDWHRLEEDKFLARLADLLKQGVHAGNFEKIVLVAPPTALGALRKVLDRQVLDHVIAEVGKDLTKQPVFDIEQALTG